jgi:acyl transferase domain-containing protein/NADPH:quinone reductase-like Zn-dependent oxidoreductase/acyl carrier protein
MPQCSLDRFIEGVDLLSVDSRTGTGRPGVPMDYSTPTVQNECVGRDGDDAGRDDIAVIGVSCRLPAASGPEEFWRLLREGVDATSAWPADRGSGGSWRGGFLGRVDGFDAEFFGVEPDEAAAMDPQQRLILELAWEVMEDAGVRADQLCGGRAGVFIGAMSDDYATLAAASVGPHSLVGQQRAVIANRVSWSMGLRGPSFVVDAAQASSLVAVHLACESLRRDESDVAFAGGVNLILSPRAMPGLAALGVLSARGRSAVLDESADGFVRGEGGGVVLLKPLDRAVVDGDPIYCVIRGSAVNNDGAGDRLTDPDVDGQRDVLRRAYAVSGHSPRSAQYVEMHGTGTPVGDPVEAAALGSVVGRGDPGRFPLAVGSVKTNIGHLEGAAGIAGLIKTALAIRHRQLPPTLHFRRAHPAVDLAWLNIRVQTDLSAWPRPEQPLVAGVSSFGIGGTNCHVVLAEGPRTGRPTGEPVDDRDVPWVVSAGSGRALAAQVARLRGLKGVNRADVGWSLTTTRTLFDHRAVLLGDEEVSGVAASGRTAFMFTGQGAQRPGMGGELYAAYPAFAAALDEVLDHFDPRLRGVWSGAGADAEIHQTRWAQPALFAYEVALHRLLAGWGMTADVLIGHSLGEITAAHLAGMMSLRDAATLVEARARLMQEVPTRGVMVALEATEEEILPVLADGVGIGAVNGPRALVLSGPEEAVTRVTAGFANRRSKRLRVSVACHSVLMEPILDAFADVARGLTYHAPNVTVISNLTGQPLTEVDADYWVRHLRGTVRFHEGVSALNATRLIEIGPDSVLTPMVRSDATVVALQVRDRPEGSTLERGIAKAFVAGARVDWAAVIGPARTVALPTYPFQRERYWHDERPTAPRGHESGTTLALRDRVRKEPPEFLGRWVDEQVTALGVPENPDRSVAFRDLGVDSGLAVRLRDNLAAGTGLRLPSSLLFEYPTPEALTENLRRRILGTDPARPAAETLTAADDDPIAIVGMACRLPGGIDSAQQLWRTVLDGADVTSELPGDRGWDLDALFHGDPGHGGTSYSSRGGFLVDAGGFDTEFFGISPREAAAMDPQQRILLEVSWEAFENAGVSPKAVRGEPVGVFVGAATMEYGPRLYEPAEGSEGYRLTGTASSVASGRVAYTYGLEGPAVTVDTACSSSLVAVHLAAQALRAGECSLALAGGVTVMSTPGIFVEFSRQRGLSPDGRCKSFSDDADGTGWGEGAGLLVLERLSDARRNGHDVHAVVRGSAVNSDGASNGLTAPNGLSQQRVIRQALANARLSPADVDVIEAHGTGTTLGDPIEAHALLATYGADRASGEPAWLGSVKSNIGHTQAAAGVAGVIKMVMAMRNATMPRTLHVSAPSRHIDWESGAVALLRDARQWPSTGRPRRAAVSSFGISGTNAHVVLEQGPEAAVAAETDETALVPLLLSARSEEALSARAAQIATVLSHARPLDVGRSLAQAYASLEHRAVVIGRGSEELIAGLAQPVVRGRAGDLGAPVFVFPGQGSQWLGMGRRLLTISPVFAARIDECAAVLEPHTDWSLTAVLAGDEPADRVDVIQPVLWAVMVSLAAVWQSYGVEPAAVIGHSQGEIAAAVVAGGLSLADGAKVVALRSRVLKRIVGRGGMVSVAASSADVEARLHDDLSIAVVNGPAQVVVAGSPPALAALLTRCDADGIRTRQIPVDYASHSVHVASLETELVGLLSDIEPRSAAVPFWSTVTSEPVDTAGLDAGYWYTNLRTTVHFADTVAALAKAGHRAFIEVSPHPVLTSAIAQIDADAVVAGTLRRDEPDDLRLLTSLAEAHVAGIQVDWSSLFTGAHPVSLPPYPFRRQRFWRTTGAGGTEPDALRHPLLQHSVTLADGGAMVLTGRISATEHDWLGDHVVAGTVLLPGAAFVELALRAADEAGCDRIEDLTIEVPLALPDTGTTQLQLVVGEAGETGRRSFGIYSIVGDQPRRHVVGSMSTGAAPAGGLGSWPPPGAQPVDLDGFYASVADRGYGYGPAFQGLRAAWRAGDVVYAEVESSADGFGIHPALLDAVLHPLLLGTAGDGLLVPFSWADVTLSATGATTLRVRIEHTGTHTARLVAVDPDDQPVITVGALTMRPLTTVAAPRADTTLRVHWRAADPAEPVAPAGRTVVVAEPGGDVRERLAEILTVLQRPQSVVVVTRGALIEGPDPVTAAVWGLVRSAQTEEPGRLVLIDVEEHSDDAIAAALGTGESQCAVRAGRVLVPRLIRTASAALAVPPGNHWRLGITARGTVENLALLPGGDQYGDVRVAVRAGGLNFRDVLNVLGMYPGDAGALGFEGAGVVVQAAGGFAAGDRVMGLFPAGALGPTATTDHRLLSRFPAEWSFAEAAAVPVAFLTAHHGLLGLAQLKTHEKVLIHAGTGGVGMAAIQLARHAGAEVYATASPGKWEVLRGLGLDDEHIASSRTLDFAERFPAGMHVVLNSLAGAFTDASLRLLASGGRFVEMGKTDIRTPEGVDYQPFDLLDVDPARIAGMLAALRPLFASGDLGRLPVRAWDVREAPDAFRHLSQAKHVGKVVLTVPRPIDPDGTVVVTGASGMLGRLVTEHLGARHTLLLSRSAGVDVADRDQLAAAIAGIPAEHPLTAVVHCAGVLDDGIIGALDPQRLDTVLRPKVDAVRHLDELTAGADLAAFVLFSSIAGVLGTAGQGNYAAANAYLDAFAARRHAAGRPVVSIVWGLWSQRSGMTGGLRHADHQRLRRIGVLPVAVDEGLAAFDRALMSPQPVVIPVRVDAAALRAGTHSVLLNDMARRPGRRVAAEAPATSTSSALRNTLAGLPDDQRDDLLTDLVQAEAATVLGLTDASDMAPGATFRDVGFDSLTAVELRNRLNARTGLRLSSTVVFDHPNPRELVQHLQARLTAPADDLAMRPPSSSRRMLQDLARIKDELRVAHLTAEERREIETFLRGLLENPAAGAGEGTGLEDASASEVLDFINNSLGLSIAGENVPQT